MTPKRIGRWMPAWGLAAVLLGTGPAAGQGMEPDDDADPAGQSPAAQKFKELTETRADAKPQAKEKVRPPFEFFRTRVAPFDVLPFAKAGHWSTLTLEMRANLFNYDGLLQTAPVPLLGMPHAIVFRRDLRLVKEQPAQPALQVMLPGASREIVLNLTRPDSIRPDDGTQAPLRRLEAHQMIMPILARDPNAYANWNRFLAMRPASGNQDTMEIERRRYYRLSIPQEPEKPLVSPHPLTWTTTSHVLWDDFDPNALSLAQQRAMLDWLHWGGQLIVVGGASRTLALLADRESFLGPYLPAEPSGENASLTGADLRRLARSYPPPEASTEPDESQTTPGGFALRVGHLIGRDELLRMFDPLGFGRNDIVLERGNVRTLGDVVEFWPASEDVGYRIELSDDEVVALAVIDPVSGAVLARKSELLFDPANYLRRLSDHRYQLAVAIRPAPGRPVFLAGLRPRDGATVTPLPLGDLGGRLLGVEGRVGRGRILMLGVNPTDPAFTKWPGLDTLVRRLVLRRPEDPTPTNSNDAVMLAGPDLSWVRYLGRDLGANASGTAPGPDPAGTPSYASPLNLPTAPVAAWLDDAKMPSACRAALSEASGISIPGASFVLKVILAYLIALVPLNWLLCRFVLRRREWAWLVVPLLALGFAIAVERAAAFDLGYDSACDEIDLVELQEGYARAHLNRFAALYSTGRVRYAISYPQDPLALALPLNTNLGLRGEDIAESVWQSAPVPALIDFPVQPRSLAMFRAEQMIDLKGTIALTDDAGTPRVVNGTDLELHDAVLVDVDAGLETPLGTIGPGAAVAASGPAEIPAEAAPAATAWIDPAPFLESLRAYRWDRPEDRGEVRLVAWARAPRPGQTLEPAVDRHRGFTLVVAHLRFGPPPSPDDPPYSSLR